MTRIATDLPDVRVVVLVRDPVERAYSQHAHEVARGFENERDFLRALALEPTRLHGVVEQLVADPTAYSFSHQHHAYRGRGEYIEYLVPMADLLGRERVHVVDSGAFFTEPEKQYDAILDFLGLPRTESYPPFERHNARPRVGMPERIRAALTEYYAPYDARLAAWLGQKLSWMR